MLRRLLALTVCFVASMFVAQAQDFNPREFLSRLIPYNENELTIYSNEYVCSESKGGATVLSCHTKITIDRYLTTITCDYLDQEFCFYVDSYIDYKQIEDMEQIKLSYVDSNNQNIEVILCKWVNGPIHYIAFESKFGYSTYFLADNDEVVYHTMQESDIISHLAVKYNTTSKKIMMLNPFINPARIRIGQKIRVK